MVVPAGAHGSVLHGVVRQTVGDGKRCHSFEPLTALQAAKSAPYAQLALISFGAFFLVDSSCGFSRCFMSRTYWPAILTRCCDGKCAVR